MKRECRPYLLRSTCRAPYQAGGFLRSERVNTLPNSSELGDLTHGFRRRQRPRGDRPIYDRLYERG